jgi:hypothetical protein
VDSPLYSVRLTPLVTRVKETAGPVPAPATESANNHVAEGPNTNDSVNGENNSANDSVNAPSNEQPSQPRSATDTTQTEQTTANDESTPLNSVAEANDVNTPLTTDTAPSSTDSTVKNTPKEHSFKKPASQATHVRRPPPPKGTKVYYVSKFSKVLGSWREVYTKVSRDVTVTRVSSDLTSLRVAGLRCLERTRRRGARRGARVL